MNKPDTKTFEGNIEHYKYWEAYAKYLAEEICDTVEDLENLQEDEICTPLNAYDAARKLVIEQTETLQAENAKLQESNKAMAELLKEELQAYREIVSKGDGHKFEVNVYDCETQILEIERVLTAAGQKNIKDMKEKVLAYLKSQNTGKGPTDIGLALGKDYNTASSSVSPALKQLTKDGIIKRQKVDGKITYQYKR